MNNGSAAQVYNLGNTNPSWIAASHAVYIFPALCEHNCSWVCKIDASMGSERNKGESSPVDSGSADISSFVLSSR